MSAFWTWEVQVSAVRNAQQELLGLLELSRLLVGLREQDRGLEPERVGHVDGVLEYRHGLVGLAGLQVEEAQKQPGLARIRRVAEGLHVLRELDLGGGGVADEDVLLHAFELDRSLLEMLPAGS